jgi:hypothetical protein
VSAAETGQATVKAVKAQARRLGLEWQLLPATTGDVVNQVILDGSSGEIVDAIPLQGEQTTGARVMCLQIPDNGTTYILGNLNSMPQFGELVARLRLNNNQSFPDAGSGTFVSFDTIDYDPWGGFDITGAPDRWTAPFPGVFFCNGRMVFTTNSTSRRAAFINTNGTTSGTGSRGGQSLQAPAAGTAQISATGTAFLQTGEYVGLRGIQNSGAPLTTSTSDGGCMLEIFYQGQVRS